MKSIDILGVNISVVDIPKACAYIEDCIVHKRKTYICIAPVSTVVDCQRDLEYRKLINGAGMTTPDGVPLVWLGKLAGHKTIERTYGPDLVLAVCRMSQEKGYKHYFYGGTPEACRALELKLKKKFPRLSIVGKHSPPFRNLTNEEDQKIIEEINRSNPDVLWVGLGSPRQDYWMAEHRDQLDVPVMVGVGAAFDFLSGMKKQAPRWIQSLGLEWFFRLCCEPKRLWKRYLIGNTKFIYYLLKDFFRNKPGTRSGLLKNL